MRKRQLFVHRTDVDHLAASLGLHTMLYKSLRNKKWPFQIDIQDRVIVLFRDIPKIGPPLEPRVVHQDVYASELTNPVIDKALALGDSADIALNCHGLAASFLHGRDNFISAGLVGAETKHHIRALCRQTLHNGPANPLIAAGNGSYFAFQSVSHGT